MLHPTGTYIKYNFFPIHKQMAGRVYLVFGKASKFTLNYSQPSSIICKIVLMCQVVAKFCSLSKGFLWIF